MVIFRRTQGLEGGVISGGKGPVILSPSRNREASKVKIIINLIKLIINLNKVKEKIKSFQEIISIFI